MGQGAFELIVVVRWPPIYRGRRTKVVDRAIPIHCVARQLLSWCCRWNETRCSTSTGTDHRSLFVTTIMLRFHKVLECWFLRVAF